MIDYATRSLQAAPPVQAVSKPHCHDRRNIRITLRQWKMLHAVVDCGGFTDAAEFLHISQSAISSSVAKLQQQLGVPLFRPDGRRARLTDAGMALLDRSRYLVRDALELEMFAENLHHRGSAPHIQIIVDYNCPTVLVTMAVRKMLQSGLHIRVSLSEAGGSQTERAVYNRSADLAITAHVPPGFHSSLLLELEYIPVAHPEHPLFKLDREITSLDLDQHVQVVIADTPEENLGGDEDGRNLQRWNVRSFDTAVGTLIEGMGYAWLPKHRILGRLDRNALAVLPIRNGGEYKVRLYLVRIRQANPGSSANVLAELLCTLASVPSTAHATFPPDD